MLKMKQVKTKIINTTYKIILQNTNTALQDTGIQYSIIIFGIQARCLSRPVSQFNLRFLFISCFKLFVMLAPSSQSYLLTK